MKRMLFVLAAALMPMLAAAGQGIVTSDTTINTHGKSVRLSVQGGYAYRLGKVDKSQGDVMTEHAKSLRHGFTYGADATWYFMDFFGAGVKYNSLHVGNAERVTVSYDDGTTASGTMEDKINIWFLGPFASYRLAGGNTRGSLLFNFGVGYMGYKDNATLVDSFMIKGGTAGLLYEIGYDLALTDKISLGAMMTYASGYLSKCKTNTSGTWQTVTLEKGRYERLDYLNLSIGIRINL